ncbi:MFS transporter [Reyranella sp. CPCC 100927]|uniref:MFS transporter n=1 Tax=Reyranella sp. CPCC 100927 TaxID=2599616 RepID=UPI0011B675F2|nr:MFS transporter [Reyranella sp. CPCC 100927]TWT10811.1 MFS transporter [Reyranella sp. CPCC 100927]
MSETKDLLSIYDSAPLNWRYWVSLGLGIATTIFDFFDFFLVSFLVVVLAPQWHLTFGQSAIMLLSAGVGAIVGALCWGALADIWGRKKLFVAGILLCAVAAGAVAFIPDGAWVLFSVLRFLVGFGVGAAAAVGLPLIVEYTPTRYRTVMTSAAVIPVSFGILAASLSAATLLQILGWRGLAALGFIPILPAIGIVLIMPESVRWLVSRGRTMEARATMARFCAIPEASLPMPTAAPVPPASASFTDLLADPRRLWLTIITWFGASTASYGVFLWGPTIVALLLGLAPKDAAHLFVYVSLVGIVGRVIFTFLPLRIGRRRSGEIMGYGIAVTLGAAGLFYDQFAAGWPVFMIMIVLGALFFDGGFSNIGPYSAEIFPVRLAARGVGLAQAANGVGKIAGPLCLALIAGTGNFVSPKATAEAVTPAFLFLAGCGLLLGLAFTFLGVETHGKALALTEADPGQASAQQTGSARTSLT